MKDKYIYYDDLPKVESGPNIGRIDWEKAIDQSFRFYYYGIEGTMRIQNKNKHTLTVEYNGELFDLSIASFWRGGLSSIIKNSNHTLKRVPYKYKVGDIVNGCQIVRCFYDKYKARNYQYKCIQCGYEHHRSEERIERGCHICNHGHHIDPNRNGIKSTHPEIYRGIALSQEERDVLSHSSCDVVPWECKFCGSVNKNTVRHLCAIGYFPCKYCGDKISYPEMILNNVMSQISNTYELQYRIDNKKYDVFDNGIYIEINGIQHYDEKHNFSWLNGRDLDFEKKNDEYKQSLAEKQIGYKDYIIIDARKSEFEYIKTQIINNKKMNKYYNLSNVDWNAVLKRIQNNLGEEIVSLWNSGLSKLEISEKLKKHPSTIKKYLLIGEDLGLCIYRNTRRKSSKYT